VDDCPDNRDLVRCLARTAGVEVELAEDGQDGVEKALAKHFDLILMDMQMPNMDGYTATRVLREKGSSVPVVALTASALPSKLEQCVEAGCNECLTKPFEHAELFGLLERYLS